MLAPVLLPRLVTKLTVVEGASELRPGRSHEQGNPEDCQGGGPDRGGSRRRAYPDSAIRLRDEAHAGAIAYAVAGALAGVFESGVIDGAMTTGAELAAEGLQLFWTEAACSDGGFFLFWRLSGHRSSLGC
jgi:hypothetical protein